MFPCGHFLVTTENTRYVSAFLPFPLCVSGHLRTTSLVHFLARSSVLPSLPVAPPRRSLHNLAGVQRKTRPGQLERALSGSVTLSCGLDDPVCVCCVKKVALDFLVSTPCLVLPQPLTVRLACIDRPGMKWACVCNGLWAQSTSCISALSQHDLRVYFLSFLLPRCPATTDGNIWLCFEGCAFPCILSFWPDVPPPQKGTSGFNSRGGGPRGGPRGRCRYTG